MVLRVTQLVVVFPIAQLAILLKHTFHLQWDQTNINTLNTFLHIKSLRIMKRFKFWIEIVVLVFTLTVWIKITSHL